MNVRGAVDTLLYALNNNEFCAGDTRIAFLNAVFHANLFALNKQNITLQQHFKPYADELVQAAFQIQPEIPDGNHIYDLACVLAPKNIVETRYFIAKSAQFLRSGGILLCAADNKAGGTRLKKIMQDFGFQDIQNKSRNKARAVWGRAQRLNETTIEKACKAGEIQNILDNTFISQPGIFGWNKIDKGSHILTQNLPQDLKGKGADFGCGYGYLSDFILSHCPKIKHLSCIDADYRAVKLCAKNLEKFDCNTNSYPLNECELEGDDCRPRGSAKPAWRLNVDSHSKNENQYKKDFFWSDLTQYQDNLKNLDFIIMNPPFHEGKKTDSATGQRFIETAYQTLRNKGTLWMVANTHLPYENILQTQFSNYKNVYEGQRFKIFCAEK